MTEQCGAGADNGRPSESNIAFPGPVQTVCHLVSRAAGAVPAASERTLGHFSHVRRKCGGGQRVVGDCRWTMVNC